MPRRGSNKVKLTLSVDKNILELARSRIPNLSAFFEIKVLETVKLGNKTYRELEWTGGDLNPRPPPCQGGALPG